jgi:hypothetical protein
VNDEPARIQDAERRVVDPSGNKHGNDIELAALEKEIADLVGVRIDPLTDVLDLDARVDRVWRVNEEVEILRLNADAIEHGWRLVLAVRFAVLMSIKVEERSEVFESRLCLERAKHGDL